MRRRRAEAEERRGEAEEETRLQDQRRSSMISTQYPVLFVTVKIAASPQFSNIVVSFQLRAITLFDG